MKDVGGGISGHSYLCPGLSSGIWSVPDHKLCEQRVGGGDPGQGDVVIIHIPDGEVVRWVGQHCLEAGVRLRL